MSDRDAGKIAAAHAALEFVKSGMIVGLGTGTTSSFFVQALGERVRRGLRIEAVPTSNAIEQLARDEGIPTSDLDAHLTLDIAIDGADAVDPQLELLKGLGGALLREKIVARAAATFVVIVGASKRVESLAQIGRVPVEVLAFGWRQTADAIEHLGFQSRLRVDPAGSAIVTDNGNYVLDVRAPDLMDAESVGRRLKAITGVVEHGLFVGMADIVLVGHDNGSVQRLSRR